MAKICDLISVRGGDLEFPVQLYRDDDTGRVVVRGINEGGFSCVDIDLCDLLEAIGAGGDVEGIARTLGEHPG